MKMKKGLGILAVLLAFTMVACNGVSKTSEEGEEPQQSSLVPETKSQQIGRAHV